MVGYKKEKKGENNQPLPPARRGGRSPCTCIVYSSVPNGTLLTLSTMICQQESTHHPHPSSRTTTSYNITGYCCMMQYQILYSSILSYQTRGRHPMQQHMGLRGIQSHIEYYGAVPSQPGATRSRSLWKHWTRGAHRLSGCDVCILTIVII